MHSLLVEAKLAGDSDAKTKKLFFDLQKGTVYGRSDASASTRASMLQQTAAAGLVSEEMYFLFPEFIECVARAEYVRALESGLDQREGEGLSFQTALIAILLQGLEKMVSTLTAKAPTVQPTGGKKRPGPAA